MNNREKSQRFPAWASLYLVLTILVLAFGFYQAMTAPKEATMGNLYRVFFYHFPHTILSFVFPYLNFVAAFLYLFWRNNHPRRALAADAFALASAEVAVLYASVGLATGMLWARAAWGIWWAWDARLTTYLLLWLLYVSYLLLRGLTSGNQRAVLSAVLAIFAAIDVPICYMSIRWWRTQHPAPVFGGGADSGIDPHMLPAVLWNLAAWTLWGAFVLGLRYAIERRRQRNSLAEHTDVSLPASPTPVLEVR
ncbi:MAG TPA: cytochrome c biogenesis protein CcsA [Acidobacteriaceae bacterium]|nr:cytochrome c biogenesis protein CcsA [Acidobacteriaceae bacterium]